MKTQNTFSQSHEVQHTPARRIVFLLLPEVNLLDLAGPAQVFHTAAWLGAHYQIEYQSEQPTLLSAQGLSFAGLKPLAQVSPDDIVIVPGPNLVGRSLDDPGLAEPLRAWLRSAYAMGAGVASVCTGAFALGDAGLLDGRRCTTHWEAIGALQARYPAAKVLDTVLYVHDQRITTSAGIASGIDLALSLVEQDYGPLFTAQVAHYMVIYLRRDGTQPQTSIYLQFRTHLHPNIHRVQDYLIEHATESLSLDHLGTIAGMSVRSLNRLFKEATGLTPIQYQQRLRLELAANLIHNPALSIEAIAAKCGFQDARHFRRLWQRQFGRAPSALRATSDFPVKGSRS
jgi:transcriptional regulator GlxA family with amidase domain